MPLAAQLAGWEAPMLPRKLKNALPRFAEKQILFCLRVKQGAEKKLSPVCCMSKKASVLYRRQLSEHS